MFITLLLLLVPTTALGLVLAMGHLEDSLLRQPARGGAEPEGTVAR